MKSYQYNRRMAGYRLRRERGGNYYDGERLTGY